MDEGRRFYERVGPHLDGIEEAAITTADGRVSPGPRGSWLC
jgi:hypothetical protein